MLDLGHLFSEKSVFAATNCTVMHRCHKFRVLFCRLLDSCLVLQSKPQMARRLSGTLMCASSASSKMASQELTSSL